MKKRSDLKQITDPKKKKVTISKRKKGVIRKAIELSALCGLDVFMVIFDREQQKLFELNSDPDFDHHVISHMLDKYNV